MVHAHKVGINYNLTQEPIYTEFPVLEVKEEVIFPTPFYKFKLDIENSKILQDCYDLKEYDPKGSKKSNVGGWQSEVYTLFSINKNLTPNIQNLAHNVILAANDISRDYGLDLIFDDRGCDWWVNINDSFCYNAIHSHPGSALVALYYPKISSMDQGNLSLVRCDGSHHIPLYQNREDYVNYELNAEEGCLYMFPSNVLHFVKPNQINETRVSIAFNLSINNV